jgi:hypothetical protein
MRHPLALLAIALTTALLGGSPATARAPATAADLDCSDFSSQAAAQNYFLSVGGPASDPGRARRGRGRNCVRVEPLPLQLLDDPHDTDDADHAAANVLGGDRCAGDRR